MSKQIEQMIDTLREAFNNDPAYRYSWQANIAMAFVDDVRWYQERTGRKHLSNQAVHEVANTAADRFLTMLTARSKNEQTD